MFKANREREQRNPKGSSISLNATNKSRQRGKAVSQHRRECLESQSLLAYTGKRLLIQHYTPLNERSSQQLEGWQDNKMDSRENLLKTGTRTRVGGALNVHHRENEAHKPNTGYELLSSEHNR